MSNSEEQFIQSVRQVLDRSLQDVEDSMGSRLDAVRAAALARNPAEDPALDEALLTDSVLIALEDQPQADFVDKRLDAIRAQAISRLGSTPVKPASGKWASLVSRFFAGGFPVTASMVATACVLVTVVSLVYVNGNSGGNLSLDDELVLIASADDLELYENLDFYLWLDENGFAN